MLGLISTIFSISSISKYVPQNELLFARDSVRRYLDAIGAPSYPFLNFRFWKLVKCDGVLLGLASNKFSFSSIWKYVPQNEFLPARDSVLRDLEAIVVPSDPFLNFRLWKLHKCNVVLLGLISTIFSITSISKYIPPNVMLFARDSVRRHLEAIAAPSD